jgi:transcriptional regulator GlxA family with amidase domain
MGEDRAMTVFTGDGRHRVAVLARDGVLPFELSIVHRLFGQAREPAGAALYEVVTCALVPGEIRTDADFTITVTHGPEALGEADTVVVPAAQELTSTRTFTRRFRDEIGTSPGRWLIRQRLERAWVRCFVTSEGRHPGIAAIDGPFCRGRRGSSTNVAGTRPASTVTAAATS